MRRACMLLVVLGGLSAAARAAPHLHEFHWRLPFVGELNTGTLYRAPVPFTVYDGSRSFPADVRVVGEDGTNWPFFIHSAGATEPLRPLPLAASPPPDGEEAREGVQRIYFDVGYRFLPLRSLTLETSQDSFARTVKVYGRNHATNQWRWMADSGVHRLPGSERVRIELQNSRYRLLKVELFNYDEPPLAITSALAGVEAQFLVTQPSTPGRGHLYFGSALFYLPRFELQHRISRAALDAAQPAAFGDRRRNPRRLMHEIGSYARLLGILILAAAGLFGLVFVSKSMRNRRPG